MSDIPICVIVKQKGGKNKNRKRGKDEQGLDSGLGDVDIFDQRFDREEWLKKNAVHLGYDAS